MKTSLEKIVDLMLESEGRVAIVSREYSPASIAIGVLDKVTGQKISDLDKSDREKFFNDNYENVSKYFNLPTGESKFTALKILGRGIIEVQTLILEELMKGEVKLVITDSNEVLFNKTHEAGVDKDMWADFTNIISAIMNVKFVAIEDDYPLRGQNVRRGD